MERLQVENEELRLVRESNNKEFIRLETELLTLKTEKDRAERESNLLKKEKNTLLDYIEELQEKNKQQLKDVKKTI